MSERSSSRRRFLSVFPGVVVSALLRGREPGEAVLDFHQHSLYYGRSHEQLIVHQAVNKISKTVLLPGEGWMLGEMGGNQDCASLVSRHPDSFVRFACSDPADPKSVDILKENIRAGAVGIGVMKFRLAVDSPEMRRIYEAAQVFNMPVHVHFEREIYNSGIERLEALLKAYPKVKFICHGSNWWAHLSSELDPKASYPKGPIKPAGLADRLLSDYPNVYGDLSARSGLNAITRDPDFTHGFLKRQAQKLLWGSDCECLDGKGAGATDRRYCLAARSLSTLAEFAPDRESFRRIVYENGAALLALKEI